MEIAGYRDLTEIGRGAFATVFRATQVALDREVALKVLQLNVADEDAKRRFDRECKSVAGLGWHPHVLPVYDAGRTTDGKPYLSMELLTGGTLADLLRGSGPLAEQDAVTVAIQVADALAAAHEAGVVHRDVKPGNILLDRFGSARLGDFGVAQVAGAESTTGDSLSGTLGFLAPELLDGQPASPSSDVYALGATLHLMVTGQAAFRPRTGETPLALLHRISHEPVVDPAGLGVSDRVAALIRRSLEKRPGDRFPTAHAFIEAAERAMVGSGWPLVATYTSRPDDARPVAAEVTAPVEPPVSMATPVISATASSIDPDRTSLPPPSTVLPAKTYRSYVESTGHEGVGHSPPSDGVAGSAPGAVKSTLGRSRTGPPATGPDRTEASDVAPSPAAPSPRPSGPGAAGRPAPEFRATSEGPPPTRVPVAHATRATTGPKPDAPGPARPDTAGHGDDAPPSARSARSSAADGAGGIASPRRRPRRKLIATLAAVVVLAGLAAGGAVLLTADTPPCPAGSLDPSDLDELDRTDETATLMFTFTNLCETTQTAASSKAVFSLIGADEQTILAIEVDLSADPLVVGHESPGFLVVTVPLEPFGDASDRNLGRLGWTYSMAVSDTPDESPNDPGPLKAVVR